MDKIPHPTKKEQTQDKMLVRLLFFYSFFIVIDRKTITLSREKFFIEMFNDLKMLSHKYGGPI